MADLDLLTLFCPIGPDVLAGGVNWIVFRPGVDFAADPGRSDAYFNGI
jgi:hypothetical protein